MRDSLIYFLTGLAVVCFGVYLGFHPPKHQIASKWIEFAIVTAIVFGLLAQAYWGYRKSVGLWLTLFLILVLHILAFSLLLIHYDGRWPLSAKVILFVGEWTVLATVMYWIHGFIPYSKAR